MTRRAYLEVNFGPRFDRRSGAGDTAQAFTRACMPCILSCHAFYKGGQGLGSFALVIWENASTGGISRRRKRDSDVRRVRVSASQAILDRGYGRPATFSTTDTTQFKRAIDMTDDGLAAIVAKARLSIVK